MSETYDMLASGWQNVVCVTHMSETYDMSAPDWQNVVCVTHMSETYDMSALTGRMSFVVGYSHE